MKLSIIIPAYNEEKTINKIIDLVLSVDLINNIEKELIIVDDCSSDNTSGLALDLASKHTEINYFKHQKNQGKGAAIHTGIKEATGDLDRAKQVIDLVGNDIAVYSGDDATAYQLMLLGGHGNISVTANVLPKKMAELCRLSIAGKAEEAEALNAELMAMHNVLFLESNPIPVKWALHEMGRMSAGIRLPLTPLAEQYRGVLKTALTSFSLVK